MREPWNACIVDTLPWPIVASAAAALAETGAPPEKPLCASWLLPSSA
jgi:hypothetical protein